MFWASPPSTLSGGTLSILEVDGGRPRPLLPTTREGEDADPVFSPDGRTIAFRRRMDDGTAGGNLDIVRIAADGRGLGSALRLPGDDGRTTPGAPAEDEGMPRFP